MRQQIDDGIATADSRLARRQADLDELARTEQRKIVRRGAHGFPVGDAFDEVDFAFVEPGAPGARADGVGRFADEQRFVAGYEIGPRRFVREVRAKGFERELQGRDYSHRAQPVASIAARSAVKHAQAGSTGALSAASAHIPFRPTTWKSTNQ